jgi:rhamnosyltransferase subunit B
MAANGGGKRIVMNTFGSFGDLHPYIAIGKALLAKGHRPVIATMNVYRDKTEAEGIEFASVGPHGDSLHLAPELMAKVMDGKSGSQFILREMLMPRLRESYEELMAACERADALLSHVITYAAPIVGEKLGLPWAMSWLQPMPMASAYEPLVLPQQPKLAALFKLGPGAGGALIRLMKKMSRSWVLEVDQLRAQIGLPPPRHPIFEGFHSPHMNLALFSKMLGCPQPDWPAKTIQTGFPFFDQEVSGQVISEDLREFLAVGTPPLVFTLGSSAVMIGGDFYEASIRAVQALDRRAVLLVGPEGVNRLPSPLPKDVLAVPYAPHSELFPHAAAIVHQGGVGTTGQGLRSGKPTLIVPFAHDQPDNAARCSRLGASRTLPRHRYTAARATFELRKLLEDPSYASRAEAVGGEVRKEHGAEAAADALIQLACGTP